MAARSRPTRASRTTSRPPKPSKAPKPRGRPAAHGRDAAEEARRNAEQFPNARLIKRYGNRRLYDARLSRGVTLEEIEGFVRRGENVRVVDAESGEEITRRILVQILLEQKSARMLELIPIELLRSMIAMPNEPLTQWLAEYLAAGARWVEWQTGRAGAPPVAPSGLGGFPNWPIDDSAPAQARPSDPSRPRRKKKGAPRDAATADLRSDLDALWRRMGELRR